MTETTKSAAQIAHEQRNADRKAEAQQRKVDRFLGHVERNNDAATAKVERRTARVQAHGLRNDRSRRAAIQARAEASSQDEAVLLKSATRAFAEAIEGRFGIIANDNAAIAKAA